MREETDINNIIRDLLRSLKDYDEAEDPKAKTHRPIVIRPRSLDDWLRSPISQKHHVSEFFLWFEARLDYFFALLCNSPTFQAMVKECPSVLNTKITFQDLEKIKRKAGAMYTPEFDYIVVDYKSKDDDYYIPEPSPLKFVYIIHELRHAYHHLHPQIKPYKKISGPHSLLANIFIQEAEVNAFQATVCWELKEVGYSGFWHAYKNHSPELAEAFLKEYRTDIQAAKNGKSQSAVFHKWFETRRLVDCYTDDLIEEFSENRAALALQKNKPDATKPEPHKGKQDQEFDTPSSTELSINFHDSTEKPFNPFGLMPYLDSNDRLICRQNYLSDPFSPRNLHYYTRLVSGAKIEKLKLEMYKSFVKQAFEEQPTHP